jgi:hypothetical protein
MTERVGRMRLLAVAALLAANGCSSDDEGTAPAVGAASATATGGSTDAGLDSGMGGVNPPLGSGGTAGKASSGGTGTGGRGTGGGSASAGGSAPGGAGNGGSSGSAGSPPDAGVSSCLEDLTARGVGYVETQARGVVDAVELTAPLNGVLIANGTSTSPASDPVACEFVRTLWDFADLLKAHGFTRIGTLGSYCYRCCCAYSSTNFCRGPDDPEPDCSADGYSNHSWGRAIDIRYYFKTDGTRFDIDDPTHWVQWTGTGDTCVEALAAQTGTSRELYDLVCEASSLRLFSTILTPNYNAAHRNHNHLDIGESSPASGFFIRRLTRPNVDLADYGDD